ncbi:hypothetical protein MNBD_NITROSPINAE04-2193 [hydrothermal vent metagenome]|uniref:Uncharacterized protein n=1 Tax=hydrothermal vent metagenome TaxID=652676 RepID=A0A3B1BLR1_9ZZZZ
MFLKSITVFAFIAISFFTVSFAQERDSNKAPSVSGEIDLPDDLKAVLLEEMSAIEKGMAELVHEISHGNWVNIEKIGKTIEESYIVKQKLSKHQLEQLRHKLPSGFLKLDGKFHKLAGALADSAKRRNIDLVVFYFYKLNESCARCHYRYAKNRFPGFSQKLNATEGSKQ